MLIARNVVGTYPVVLFSGGKTRGISALPFAIPLPSAFKTDWNASLSVFLSKFGNKTTLL